MTRAVVNRSLLALLGLTAITTGLWLITAHYAAQLLPAGAARYLAAEPNQHLTGPSARTDVLDELHGWRLPGILIAVCLLSLFWFYWQRGGLRAGTLLLGTARVEARTLARQIAADAEGLDGVTSARARFVSADPPRLHLTIHSREDAEPAHVLTSVREHLAPRIAAVCTGAAPQIDVRFIGMRTGRGRSAPVR
jgi:hypothetical protein